MDAVPEERTLGVQQRNLVECMNLFKNNRGLPAIPSKGDLDFWKTRVDRLCAGSLHVAKNLSLNFTSQERQHAEKSFAAKATVDLFDSMRAGLAASSDVTAPLSMIGDVFAGGTEPVRNQHATESRVAVPSIPQSGAKDELSHLVFPKMIKRPDPIYHPPWKLKTVISGHTGWVRCVDVDTTNQWFATGSNDRLIKIWDLATGQLKLSLTGHIYAVRDIKISERHPYLFSCGEDNTVKCWDLEQNKVVRHYHGHLSGVYALALHPTLDILATGGRDSAVRVWDMRTREAIYTLSGHQASIFSLAAQAVEPQLLSGSQDKNIRTWDLRTGKCSQVLTHHRQTIRALAFHPRYYSFCSASADNLKVWKGAECEFERNLDNCMSIVNSIAIKDDPESAVLVAGGANGFLHFYDWRSGVKFQSIEVKPQPGSLSIESAIMDLTFDKSETRLITAEGDKTLKIWQEATIDELDEEEEALYKAIKDN